MITFSPPRRMRIHGRACANWYTRVLRDDGKNTWRSLGTPDLAEAHAAVQKLIEATPGSQLSGGKGRILVSPGVIGHGLEEVLLAWMASKERAGNAASSLRTQHYAVGQWARMLGPRTPIESITTADIEGMLERMAAAGSRARTVNNHLDWIRGAFSWAMQRGLIERNPANHIPRQRELRRRVQTLSEDQQQRFLAACDERGVGLWAAILLYAGFRRGTTEALTWEDVDLTAGRWHIPARKIKSRQDYHSPIAPVLLGRLRAARGSAGAKERITSAPTSAVWKAVCRDMGLSDFRPHDLRRTFLTRLRRSGVGLDVAMSLSDHHDLKTVLECYRAVDAEEQAGALQQAFGD
jgi:integrase